MTTLPEKFKIQDDFPEISFDDWKKTVERELEGIPFEQRLKTKTYEGIYLQFIYTKKDIENLPHISTKPGFKDFIRGTKADGYLGNIWLIAQEIPYPKPEEFNEALKYDLERGQNAINIILDKSTQ
ncbi:MAG: methylmalonyl-CoA mutase family protein, partial [Ignavibacteriae bacterium]|nr:methylmalonyl-CoA mutase family protein [Ignavibacteriota bacterium]